MLTRIPAIYQEPRSVPDRPLSSIWNDRQEAELRKMDLASDTKNDDNNNNSGGSSSSSTGERTLLIIASFLARPFLCGLDTEWHLKPRFLLVNFPLRHRINKL